MSILVLGLGNPIMSDDGIGVRLVQRLAENYRFPDGVTLLDGGTLGLGLLPKLEGVTKLLVVDAVETGDIPGTVVRLCGDRIPLTMSTKMSPHQVGLEDLLAVAALQGFAPKEILLWGIQPATLELGLGLSPPVARQLERLEAEVVDELKRWGMEPVPVGCTSGRSGGGD